MSSVSVVFENSENNIKKNVKSTILFIAVINNIVLHYRPFYELGHYKNKLFSYLILIIDLLIDTFY